MAHVIKQKQNNKILLLCILNITYNATLLKPVLSKKHSHTQNSYKEGLILL